MASAVLFEKIKMTKTMHFLDVNNVNEEIKRR